jgi:hypothetical protein
VSSGASAGDVAAGIQYTRYLKEHLGITFTIEAAGSQTGWVVADQGTFYGTSGIVAMPIGVRWNPLQYGRQADAIKPFLSAGIGPVIGNTVGDYDGYRSDFGGVQTLMSVGGHVKAGADFHLARWFALSADGGYNWMADFAQPVGAINNYSGFSFGLGFGFLFGRGAP